MIYAENDELFSATMNVREHDTFWQEIKASTINNVEYVWRGGSYYDEPKYCRSVSRGSYHDDIFTGFRPILIETDR